MKDKIKQAGFKTQKELALQLDEYAPRINRMVHRGDNLLSKYLDLKKENMELREALRTFKQYLNM